MSAVSSPPWPADAGSGGGLIHLVRLLVLLEEDGSDGLVRPLLLLEEIVMAEGGGDGLVGLLLLWREEEGDSRVGLLLLAEEGGGGLLPLPCSCWPTAAATILYFASVFPLLVAASARRFACSKQSCMQLITAWLEEFVASASVCFRQFRKRFTRSWRDATSSRLATALKSLGSILTARGAGRYRFPLR